MKDHDFIRIYVASPLCASPVVSEATLVDLATLNLEGSSSHHKQI